MSAIATAVIDGAPISEDDAVNMATTLVLGGLDTVAALMSGGSDPVITKAPEGAWTHQITDKALQ